MCNNPIIKNNTVHYAAYHEETIVNCLLWKHKISRGLPNVYVNGSIETIDLINNKNTFTGEPRHIKDWVVVPSSRDELFFIHGEKRLDIIKSMIENLKETNKSIIGELTILANKYGSDKGTVYGDKHNFTEIYEKYFKPFKNKTINILEIGVNDGSSLNMWYEYFPNAKIYGLDIDNKSIYSNDRVECGIIDQSKKEHLEEYVKNTDLSFDIIIDDGSHHMSDQQLTFGFLFLSPNSYKISSSE
jgi:hypothetical protein